MVKILLCLRCVRTARRLRGCLKELGYVFSFGNRNPEKVKFSALIDKGR